MFLYFLALTLKPGILDSRTLEWSTPNLVLVNKKMSIILHDAFQETICSSKKELTKICKNKKKTPYIFLNIDQIKKIKSFRIRIKMEENH